MHSEKLDHLHCKKKIYHNLSEKYERLGLVTHKHKEGTENVLAMLKGAHNISMQFQFGTLGQVLAILKRGGVAKRNCVPILEWWETIRFTMSQGVGAQTVSELRVSHSAAPLLITYDKFLILFMCYLVTFLRICTAILTINGFLYSLHINFSGIFQQSLLYSFLLWKMFFFF